MNQLSELNELIRRATREDMILLKKSKSSTGQLIATVAFRADVESGKDRKYAMIVAENMDISIVRVENGEKTKTFKQVHTSDFTNANTAFNSFFNIK